MTVRQLRWTSRLSPASGCRIGHEDDFEKRRILKRAEDALRELWGVSDLPNRDEAEAVALLALPTLGLANVRHPETGAPLYSGDEIHHAWRVLSGGRVDARDDDAIHYRMVATYLHGALDFWRRHPEQPEAARHVLETGLLKADPAFAAISHETLLETIEAVAMDKLAVTGAIADLCIAAQALGTFRSEPRAEVQGRISRALKNR